MRTMHKSLLFLQSGGVLDRGSIPLISTKKTFQPFARNIIFAESSKISSAKKAEKRFFDGDALASTGRIKLSRQRERRRT